MMLKQLEIQGFKSFPDKVKIRFDAGVTGIVGPNGSGKSNLSDAVRWVLGETSSRQLRASGKMEQVIFGGASRRSPMGFASVRLTLDNRDHVLDLAADEAVIGRKYYRSGESEYTINGQVCRLRDVYELLLDTGIGRDGYSVIGQGRIAEIVSAKSLERREIFEEACGIAKYRYRKTEAERRLAAAGENLERLRDILGELEARVGPLERDSAKAKQFLALSAQRKTLELTLWSDNIRQAKEAIRCCTRDYETAQAQYQQYDQQAAAAEQEAEEIRIQAQQLTIAVERLNGDIRSITDAISGSASRIAVLENDILRNEQEAVSLRSQLAAGVQDSVAAAEELQRRRAEAQALAQSAQTLAQQADELSAQLEQLSGQRDESGARQDQVRGALSALAEQRTQAQVDAAAARAASEAAAQRLHMLDAVLEQDEAAAASARQELADTRQYLTSRVEEEKKLANICAGLALKCQARQQALDQADAEEQRLTRSLDAARQRLSVLQELEKNMDGYQQSVKSVMQAARAGRLRGIIGPVSGILQVEPGCEVAIETALGGALQYIVVENESAAKAAIALLRSDRAGRATFLPLDTVQPGVFRGTVPAGAKLASSLVKAEPKYQNIVSNLLGRILVVEEIHGASRVARELGYRSRVVTMDGQVINAGGSFTGGSVQRSAGLFTRRQELEALRVQAARLQKECVAAGEDTDVCKQQLEVLAAQRTAADSEQRTAESDRVRAEAECKRLQSVLAAAEAALAQHRQERESLAQSQTQQIKAQQAAEQQMEQLDKRQQELAQQLRQLDEGQTEFLARHSQLTEALGAKKLELLARQKDTELAHTQICAMEQQAGEAAARQQDLNKTLQDLASRSEDCRRQIGEIQQAKAENQTRIEAREAEIRQHTQSRLLCQQKETAALSRARAAAESREDAGREMSRLAERRAAAETECDQMAAKLWEEYQLTAAQAEEQCIPFENPAILRTQLAEVRGKIRALGSVNLAAVEEYQALRQRYDTLRVQVEDVEASKAELTRMIGSLSAQMRSIFTASFREIDQQFGRIFAELFGGGEAHLLLEDEQDVLSCGIGIQVAPPGKVIKSLEALSGGEQALVAISIYFAILAVNPAPFCILDEIEAALDDANIQRFAQYLRRISDKTQFIVITHRRGTMEAANVLYGVTMQEDGISKLLKLDLEQVDVTLVS